MREIADIESHLDLRMDADEINRHVIGKVWDGMVWDGMVRWCEPTLTSMEV